MFCCMFLWQGDDDLHIADREDADLSPHLALVPVLVQLLLQPVRIKGVTPRDLFFRRVPSAKCGWSRPQRRIYSA
jgi:hypothetical protein